MMVTKEEKTEVLKGFLPQTPTATSLPTSLELMDSRMETEGRKSLPL